ncbi:hypothetical protein OUZ56_000997 [Daphnia magna]|uniref:Uncharacterized protein n=1 Tax=Daphnia magna TaxID=35525 RepID=A0ABR0A1C2_9CRUS|nr:hypothetical protein OUZ56_000997 [Daphnia magna]
MKKVESDIKDILRNNSVASKSINNWEALFPPFQHSFLSQLFENLALQALSLSIFNICHSKLTRGGDKYQLKLNRRSTVVWTTVEQVQLFKFNLQFSMTQKWRLNGHQVLPSSGS